MNDALFKKLDIAKSIGLLNEEQYNVLKGWGFRDHYYPIAIGKDEYRSSSEYQLLLRNKKWYRFYGSTTGSSGQPFTAITDLNTRLRRGIHWQKQMNILREDTCLVLMWRNKLPSINQKRLIALGKLRLLPIYDLTGGDSSFISKSKVEMQISNLEKSKHYTFRSYVSVLKFLAQNFRSELRKLNIRRVIASGESLTTADWNIIEDGFGCPCVNVYGGTEASPIAISSDDDRRLRIQDELFHVGVIDRDGSKNIVVSDRINAICPIFAYEIGDITDGIDFDTNGSYLKNVIGRTSEIIYNSVGSLISSHFVHIIFRDELAVSKYRVFAKDDGCINISLEMIDPTEFDAVSCRVENEFHKLGFNVSGIKCESIPMLAGLKHRTIIRV